MTRQWISLIVLKSKFARYMKDRWRSSMYDNWLDDGSCRFIFDSWYIDASLFKAQSSVYLLRRWMRFWQNATAIPYSLFLDATIHAHRWLFVHFLVLIFCFTFCFSKIYQYIFFSMLFSFYLGVEVGWGEHIALVNNVCFMFSLYISQAFQEYNRCSSNQ